MAPVEIDKDGKPLRIFHRKGRDVWTHKPDEPCDVCKGVKREYRSSKSELAREQKD